MAATAEWAVALVGVPIGLVLAGATPSRPKLPSLSQVHNFFLSSNQDGLTTALIHPLIWLVWTLWAYLAFAFALSAAGHLIGRRAGSGSALLGLRRFLVPKALCGVIDVVFVGSLALGVGSPPRGAWLQAAAAATASPIPIAAGSPASTSPGQTQTPGPATYVVKRGDTLSGIALQRYGSEGRWPVIWQADHGRPEGHGQSFDDPNLIQPGWEIELPEDPPAIPPPVVPAARTYVVQRGDTLDGIAEKELGSEADEPVLEAANLGNVMDDRGDVLRIARYIQPGWRLQLPTVDNPATSAPPARVTPASPSRPSGATPGAPGPQVAPVATPGPATQTPQHKEAGAPAAPAVEPPVAAPIPMRPPARLAPTVPGKTHGVRVPGGLWPCSIASCVAAVGVLAGLRRRATRRLDRREPRRRLGPILGAVSGSRRVVDAITPHTLALLGVYQAAGRPVLPRVAGAWESGPHSFQYLLDETHGDFPEAGVDEGSGIEVTFDVRDQHVIAETAGRVRESLRRDVVPFVDEILVPVGGCQTQGWLLLPLLNEPLAVVGGEADAVAEAMLVAAGLRAGDEDLTISIAGDLLPDSSFPKGVECPIPQRLGPTELADLPSALAGEAEMREGVLKAEGCDSFAGLQAQWPALLPGWLLVLDPATAEACAAELGRLATLGVGALVMGDSPVAPRRLSAEEGRVSVTAKGIAVEDLVAFRLPPGLAAELEAEAAQLRDDEEDVEQDLDQGAVIEDSNDDAGLEATIADQPSSRVQVFLLGGFDVTRDGVEVPGSEMRSAKARELVAYLAAAGDWVSTKKLREILWPDDLDPGSRIDQLHQQASKARAWLLGKDKDPIIESRSAKNGNPGAYRLLAWVDVVAFRALVAQATPGALEEAARLYRGELLKGQDSEDHYRWVRVDGLRESEQDRYFAAAATLAESLLEKSEPVKALSVLEPALGTLRGAATEALARIAMRCEAAQANSDGVRRRYGRLTAALEQDHASAQTRNLLESLLASLEHSPHLPSPNRSGARRRPSELTGEVPSLHVVSDSEMAAAGGGS